MPVWPSSSPRQNTSFATGLRFNHVRAMRTWWCAPIVPRFAPSVWPDSRSLLPYPIISQPIPFHPRSDPDPSDALDDAGMPPWTLLLLLVLQMLAGQTPSEHCSTEEFALLHCTVVCRWIGRDWFSYTRKIIFRRSIWNLDADECI